MGDSQNGDQDADDKDLEDLEDPKDIEDEEDPKGDDPGDEPEDEDKPEDEEDPKDPKDKKDPLDEITDPEELRKKAKGYRAVANRKARSQQDDQPEKPAKPAVRQQATLSSEDVLAFTSAQVTHKEDIEYVRKFARVEGVLIEKALQDPMVKSQIERNAEHRRTAAATNTGGGRRGTNKVSPEQVLNNAREGKMPSDAEDLAEARARQRSIKK